MAGSRLLIGDLAEQVGTAPSALRFYEANGLLEAEARTESGYRVYGERAAHRVRFIKGAQSLGLKLSEIKSLIDSPLETRDSERTLFKSVIAAKLEEMQSTIAVLEARKQRLRGLDAALGAQPPPDGCHLGDCACWLPA